MIKKLIPVLIILFLHGLTSKAATYTVTSNLNSGTGSLRNVVQIANANPGPDEIIFLTDYTITLSAEIVISDTLKITGTGIGNTIIDGGGVSRIFNITTAAGLATISDMTIRNGSSTTGAGGGVFSNANLSVSRVSFSNNISNSSGGALCANMSLTLNNVTISNNKAGYNVATSSFSGDANNSGGGVYAAGPLILQGVIVCNNNMANFSGGGMYKGAVGSVTTTELTDITFDHNTAIIGIGGGLSSSMSFSLQNATITDNISGDRGGGVIIDTNTETLTLTNANILRNKAGYDITTSTFLMTGNAGGVYAHGSLILNGNITLEDNHAAGEGGALWKSGFGTVTTTGLTNLTVNRNSTNNGDGGGMYCLLSLDLSTVTTVTFTNNIAGAGSVVGNGGGLRMGNGSTLIMNGGTFSNNIAKTNGGGIYSMGIATLSNVSIFDNTAVSNGGGIYGSNFTLNNTTVTNNGTQVNGGGIYALNALTLNSSTVNNNIAKSHGGGIYSVNHLTLNTATISNNKAGYDITTGKWLGGSFSRGGGLYITYDLLTGTAPVLKGVIIFQNDTVSGASEAATSGGGAIYTDKPLLIDAAAGLTSLLIDACGAINPTDGTTTNINTAAAGGLFVNTGGNLILKGSPTVSVIIRNCTSTYTGGGIFVRGTGATLDYVTVTGNQTINSNGGGISVDASAGNFLDINHSAITHNAAQSNGGGIYVLSTYTSSNTTITNNAAQLNGGGIYGSNTLTLNNSTVSNNVAKISGGGIFSNLSLTLNTATISNNKAGYEVTNGQWLGTNFSRGGGVYATGNTSTFKGDIVFQNDTVSGASTTSTAGGGAIFTDKPLLIDAGSGLTSLLIDACGSINPTDGTTTGANSAVGGGIFVNTGGNLILKGSPSVPVTIKNCVSISFGGGIFARGTGTTLDYVTMTGNRSLNSSGGGIHGNPPTDATSNFLDIRHSTITNNIAKNIGGGISASTGVPATIANTDISGNSAFSNGGGIYAANTLTLNGITLSNNKAGYGYTNVNDAQPSWQASGDGGGVYAANMLTLQGALTCQNDTAATNGGGIYKNATSTFDVTGLTSFLVEYNTARNTAGGGIFTAAALTMSNKNGVSLTHNMAGTNGGGIAATATLRLDSLSILNNTAINQGGGVHSSGAAFTSNANTFAKNNAKDGGGIYASNTLTITNNTFSQNTASGNGGALNLNSTANVTLSSFNGNTATTSGQAIYLNNATNKTFNGNIIYGNGIGNEISLTSGISGNYNIVRTVSPFTGTGNKIISSGKIQEIFKDFLPGDLAVLNSNGGPTQTLGILRNGWAYNFVPQASTWITGMTVDQTGRMRIRGCDVDAGSIELQVIDPATSEWVSGGNADDWNDPANWKNWDSNHNLIAEPAVPSACSNVIIPEGTTTYPVLQKFGTILLSGEGYAQAACDTITFRFGGEVARTNYLNYKSAAVQLKLESNKWKMLSPPLRNMYSGDYFVDRGSSQPATATEIRNAVPAIVEPSGAISRLAPGAISMKLYQTQNPQTGTGKAASAFSGTFKNVDTPLLSATGYVVWVDDDVNTDNTFSFPKKYNYYNYYFEDGITKSRENTTSMDRSHFDRFVYESNVVDADGNFSQSVDNTTHSGTVIVGNPYMSHLNLRAFQIANATYFQPQFAIWNGSNYEYLSTGDTPISTSAMNQQTIGLLAPMEPVLMYVESSHVNDNAIPITFAANMSVTSPGNTLMRSSSQEPSNVLKLEIVKNGIRQSGLALCYKEGAASTYDSKKDVWTVIPNSVTSHISLYMLVDHSAASIHTTGDITSPIDLGIVVGSTIKKNITSGKKESYTIQICGDNKYLNNRNIYLYDALKKEKYNLSESPYSFENTTGDVIQRFQLFAVDEQTGIQNVSSMNNIWISSSGNTITVESAPEDPIRIVDVYNTMGRLLYQKTNVDMSNWTFTLPENNIAVVVKVQTQKNGKVQKVMSKVNQ